MDLIADIVLDAGKDTLALVPFLFVTYLALELLEHVAGERVNSTIRRAGTAGPAVGALLGIFRNVASPPWRRRSTLGAL